MKNCTEDMKLQLNENTLNAYINEAIKQELEESKTTAAAKAITHSPILKKFFGRAGKAKDARKFVMGLRRGKVVSGTVENAKKPFTWYARKGKNGAIEYFSDPKCTKKITDPKLLTAVKQSCSHHLTYAKNIFNSAQRNMLGAGIAAGWAVDHFTNGRNNSDAPWNENPGDGDGGTNPSDGNGGFPWDNTDPEWTPRPQRPVTPQPTQPEQQQQPDEPAEPEQQNRQDIGRIEPAISPSNLPTSVIGPQPTIKAPEQNSSLLANASNAMVKAASTNPADASEKEQRKAIRQTYRNARNAMKRDDYGPTAKQDMQTLKNVKNTVMRGNQHQTLEEGKTKLTEAQMNAYLNEAINEELEEIFGLSRSELNQKYGYQWDPNKSWVQNRAGRRANKYDMRSQGYKNAQEYEAGEGHAYGTPQPQASNNSEEPQQGMTFTPGERAPFAKEKYKVGQFQTWFNKNMGGRLVVDGIWGPKTQAAWDQWLNSRNQ